jgi:hypothetical protein
MRFKIVTTCTNRKKKSSHPLLDGESLIGGRQRDVQVDWLERIRKAPREHLVRDIYCGRGYSEIKKIALQHNASFLVISGGYGLLSSWEKIASYNITLSGSSENNVLGKVIFDIFDYNKWWQSLNQDYNVLTTTIKSEPETRYLICVSSSYWKLIESDLGCLKNYENVRVISHSSINLPLWAKNIWLPYDERFDGPDSPLPGTRSDFPQRVCSHYLKNIMPNSKMHNDIETVRWYMEKFRSPVKHTRKRINDTVMLDLMVSKLKKESMTCSLMLRWLRDDELVSCEQSRCSRIYKVACRRLIDGL